MNTESYLKLKNKIIHLFTDFKNKLPLVWSNKQARGDIIKNIGLGVFVNGIYGISDGTIEFFNLLDIIIGILTMLEGIIIERNI
jgi:hypothetical protein